MACGKSSPAPTSPSATPPVDTSAVGDGTLKVTAPTAVSPINGQKPEQELILTLRNAAPVFAAANIPLSYTFEILTPAGASVFKSPLIAGGSGTTTYKPDAMLTPDAPYLWRARAEFQGNAGPYMAAASFIGPRPKGYIQGAELYDPLIDGTTIGTIRGPVTFIPGVGARMDSLDSWISYELPIPLERGEYSALVTGVETNTEGTKTRIFAMAEGYGDVTENPARMTVEKRGDGPTGGIAWRFITSDDQVETVGDERVVREFNANETYFWEADWRNNFFNVMIRRGGVTGPIHYNMGKPFTGFYRPERHVVYAGGGPARGGATNQTVPGMIIRQVWVSERPRPSFANQ
jgi:hypothetical protein